MCDDDDDYGFCYPGQMKNSTKISNYGWLNESIATTTTHVETENSLLKIIIEIRLWILLHDICTYEENKMKNNNNDVDNQRQVRKKTQQIFCPKHIEFHFVIVYRLDVWIFFDCCWLQLLQEIYRSVKWKINDWLQL